MASISNAVIADIIGNFYEAAYDDTRWCGAVESLRQIWDGATICILLQNIRTHSGTAIHIGADESYLPSYFEEYARHNLIANALIPAPAGTIFSNWNPVPRDVWFASRFRNEWILPQDLHHLLGAKIQLVGDVMGTLQIQRGHRQDDFDSGDVDVLQHLLPAITRAAYLGHRVGTLKIEAGAAAMAVGAQGIATVVVASDGRILHLNEDAETALMRPGFGLRRRNNRLSAHDASTSMVLQQLIVDACGPTDGIAPGRGGDFLLAPSGPDSVTPTVVSVGPMAGGDSYGVSRGCYAVIVFKDVVLDVPDGFEIHARRLFELTPTEARIAAALASGMALKDAATLHGIRFSTARSHLENIFRKTGTRQQSQLVALLKSTQPLLARR